LDLHARLDPSRCIAVLDRVVRERLGEEDAGVIDQYVDLKRDRAVSTILAAVAGSPMWPSTRATWLEAATSVDWVTFRELATTLNPRSINPFTIPAPIPCEAPVTMAVFRWPLMVVYIENVNSDLAFAKAVREETNSPLVSEASRPIFRLRPKRVPRL